MAPQDAGERAAGARPFAAGDRVHGLRIFGLGVLMFVMTLLWQVR